MKIKKGMDGTGTPARTKLDESIALRKAAVNTIHVLHVMQIYAYDNLHLLYYHVNLRLKALS